MKTRMMFFDVGSRRRRRRLCCILRFDRSVRRKKNVCWLKLWVMISMTKKQIVVLFVDLFFRSVFLPSVIDEASLRLGRVGTRNCFLGDEIGSLEDTEFYSFFAFDPLTVTRWCPTSIHSPVKMYVEPVVTDDKTIDRRTNERYRKGGKTCNDFPSAMKSIEN